eukprot:15346597-Ditylum_brightwellii.AAC.1
MPKKCVTKDSKSKYVTSPGKQIAPKDLTKGYDFSSNKKALKKSYKGSPSTKRWIYLDISVPFAIGSNVSLPTVTSSSGIIQHASKDTIITSIRDLTM